MHELIGKYLAGEATEKERIIVEQWIDASEQNQKEFDLHANVWGSTLVNFKSPESEALFRQVLNRIDEHSENELISVEENQGIGKNRLLMTIMKIAASILILVSIIYGINHSLSVESAVVAEMSIIEKLNPAGQKLKTFLPDGSTVWLNAESKISYPDKFSEKTREVTLTGEAFFNVVRNEDKPFIVKTGNVATTVLGTSFNVRAFEDESTTHIALQSGKVKVLIAQKSGEQERFLVPGEGLEYNEVKDEYTVEQFDAEELLSWKDGILVFKEAKQQEVIKTLSRWYGVRFEIKNKPNEPWTYEAKFPDNATLENVLKGISFAKHFTYRYEDPKHIVIEYN